MGGVGEGVASLFRLGEFSPDNGCIRGLRWLGSVFLFLGFCYDIVEWMSLRILSDDEGIGFREVI